jgi:hypothetical protein
LRLRLCSFSIVPNLLSYIGALWVGERAGAPRPVATPPPSVRVVYGAASTPAPPNSIQLRLKKLFPGPPETGLNAR